MIRIAHVLFYLLSGIFISALPTEVVAQKAITIKQPKKPAKSKKAPAAPQTTEFYVVTSPAGATVAVDDKVIGTTPIEGIKCSRGKHTIKISKEGYETITKTENFGASPVVLNHALKEQNLTPTTLYVISKPEAAKVIIDGESVGLTPLNGHKIAKGYHQILLVKPGYDTLDVSEQILSDSKMIDKTLVKTQVKQSLLYVYTHPEGATVRIDTAMVGVSPVIRHTTPQGKHSVRIEMEGYEPFVLDTLVGSQPCIVDVNLKLKEVKPALFSIGTDPMDAEVFLNDSLIGKTPLLDLPVQPGKYSVSIKKDEHLPFDTVITFEQNTPVKLTKSMVSLAPKTFNVNGVAFTMIRVIGGKFMMGATPEQVNPYDDEKPVHEVTLDSYYMAETEVTQALFEAVTGRNPSEFTGELNNPVENVTWEECQEFVQRLSAETGVNFRLPTEAEWEYAARGGHKAAKKLFAGSDDLNAVGWNKINSQGYPHPVKKLQPNELGIYDMSGNVWEWCADYKTDYTPAAQTNPKGPDFGAERIMRGGSFAEEDPRNCRTAVRNYNTSGGCFNYLGFRIVCD